MQYWLYLRKNAHQTAVFALVSLLLSACTTVHPTSSTTTVKKPAMTASAFFSGKKNDALYPEDYYDTTGLVVNQDDIDELLGVTEMDAAARLAPKS
jgi:hypothetical protein